MRLATVFGPQKIQTCTESSPAGDCSLRLQGTNAGIQQTTVGLWTYNLAANAVVAPSAILGNLDAAIGVTLTWGYLIKGVKVAAISLVGTVETVVKFSNPTVFALQTSATPMIDIYDSGAFKIDFSVSAHVHACLSTCLYCLRHSPSGSPCVRPPCLTEHASCFVMCTCSAEAKRGVHGEHALLRQPSELFGL